jgi:choline kinase
MDAIILGAGKGKRIMELTGGEPKSFLTINDKRIIDWQLDFLDEIPVKNIIMVVGYKKERFYELYGDRKNINFVFNPFYEITNVLPSFWFGMNNLEDDTIYLHADTIFEREIFEKLVKAEGDIILPIEKKSCNPEDMKVIIRNGYIDTISKEIPSEDARGEFIGIAKISKHALNPLREIVNELMTQRKFESFFESALQLGADRGSFKLKPLDITGIPWNEIDYKEDYEKTKILFSKKP